MANCLIRLAAFQNPEFHRPQAVRLPVSAKVGRRVISVVSNGTRSLSLRRLRKALTSSMTVVDFWHAYSELATIEPDR